MLIHDEPAQLQCHECNSACSTDLEFEWHKETTHEVSVTKSHYQCNMCDFTANSQSAHTVISYGWILVTKIS